jgi:NadR type nicotinamide-nucleotide adenylyltransferase
MMRIAITGPESTGKSWLAEQLAAWYGTSWVPEYAREYLERTQGKYQYEDILKIAKGQLKSEIRIEAKTKNILFCDTEFLVTRIWCEVKYGKVHPWILDNAETHPYDLFLLCNIDLPWQFDPLREHPEMRPYLFDRYVETLDNLGANYRIVSGTGEERLMNAVRFIEGLKV